MVESSSTAPMETAKAEKPAADVPAVEDEAAETAALRITDQGPNEQQEKTRVRAWRWLLSYPGIVASLIAWGALDALVEGLWLQPVPPAILLRDITNMVVLSSIFAVIVAQITGQISRHPSGL